MTHSHFIFRRSGHTFRQQLTENLTTATFWITELCLWIDPAIEWNKNSKWNETLNTISANFRHELFRCSWPLMFKIPFALYSLVMFVSITYLFIARFEWIHRNLGFISASLSVLTWNVTSTYPTVRVGKCRSFLISFIYLQISKEGKFRD